MINWQVVAAQVINNVHKSLPADADLKARKAALRAAKPWEFRATSWGAKVWAKHTARYLQQYGQPSRRHSNSVQPTPIEELIARAKP